MQISEVPPEENWNLS